jgi:hypothetical protein
MAVRCVWGVPAGGRPVSQRHRHEYDSSFQPTGYATLSWAASPTREFEIFESCACGAVRRQRGLILPGDRDRHPFEYDASGWPITSAGERMPVVPAPSSGGWADLWGGI